MSHMIYDFLIHVFKKQKATTNDSCMHFTDRTPFLNEQLKSQSQSQSSQRHSHLQWIRVWIFAYRLALVAEVDQEKSYARGCACNDDGLYELHAPVVDVSENKSFQAWLHYITNATNDDDDDDDAWAMTMVMVMMMICTQGKG